MSITVQKSTSGAYFTILDSQDNLLRPFMVNDYDFIPDIDGVSFSLEARCCKSPDRFRIIDKQDYRKTINGDTAVAFANFAALQTYALANFFRNPNAASGGGATWGSITGTLSAQTDLAAALAGKASIVGTDKQIIFNDGGTFAGNSALQFDKATSSTYFGNPSAIPAAPTGNIVFFGTSITFGQGVSGSGVKYSTQVAALLGLTEVNLGAPGSSVEKRTPLNLPSNTNFIDRGGTIPTYSASYQWFICEVGPNDFYTASANYNPTNYQADLTTFLNLVIAAGWPLSKILVLSNSYIRSDYYTGGQTLVLYQQFITATAAVATALSLPYLNIFDGLNLRGGDANMTDALHPNNYGHTLQAQLIYAKLIGSPTYKNSQALAVNGFGEFSTLKLNNINYLPDAAQTIVGRDALGNFGTALALPNNFRTGANLIVAGQIYQPSNTVGTGYTLGAKDWLLGQNSVYAQQDAIPGNYTITRFVDGSAGYYFYTSLSSISAPNLVMAQFVNGANDVSLKILRAAGTISNNSFFVPWGTANGFGSGVVSSAYGIYEPLNGGMTNIKNTYQFGAITFNVSHGTNGNLFEAGRFCTSGCLALGGTADHGLILDAYGTARFQTGAQFGILGKVVLGVPTPSASGGALATGTYYYRVIPLDAFGNEGDSNAEQLATVTGPTGSVTVPWTTLSGAVSYRIYQGTVSGTQGKYFTAPGTATSAVDIGSGYTTRALPTQNKTNIGNISSAGDASFRSYTSTINGLTTNPVNGLVVQNTNATTAGNTVEYSPYFSLIGQGWNATAASNQVSLWRMYSRPVASNPIGGTLFIEAVMNGSPINSFQFGHNGSFTANGTISSTTLNSSPAIYGNGAAGAGGLFLNGGANYGQIQNINSTSWQLGYGPSQTALGTAVLKWDQNNNVSITNALLLASTQTSVGGSTSGTAVFGQPMQGGSYKVVIIKMAALIGTASYTFPTAFATTPSVVASDDVAAGVVTSKATTAVTVTGATTSGILMLIGY